MTILLVYGDLGQHMYRYKISLRGRLTVSEGGAKNTKAQINLTDYSCIHILIVCCLVRARHGLSFSAVDLF